TARSAARTRQVAVIDLGSNSWRLVVYSFVAGRWWKRTDELYETVRIGEGMGATGRLSESAIARGIETLVVFERFFIAHELAPDQVHAVATSAIRDASNREEFLRAAADTTKLKIEVLSEQEEARLGYVAAVNTTTLQDGAVLEIGGGSLQLIEVHDRQAGQLRSLPLGAVRITEELLPGGAPAKKKELQNARDHLAGALADIGWLAESGDRLVGLGGAVRNLADRKSVV